MPKARGYALKAVELDGSLAEARAALGSVLMHARLGLGSR